MKKLVLPIVFIFSAAAQAQPPAVAPTLEPSAVPTEITPASPVQVEAPAPPAVPALVPTQADQAVAPPAKRARQARPRHDDIDGFKYPPARIAAEKSTAWANSTSAMIGLGDGGRINVIFGQSIPKIGCAYLRVCSVELEPGEVVNKVNAGDPVRWDISPSIVGENENKTVHVIIKPKSDEPGLFTNVKIATNRRMYDLDIFSVTGEKFVRRIGFVYPENDQRAWEAQRLAMAKENSTVTAQPALTVDKLNFNYSIEGNYKHRPVRVFDDSDKTYVQMGADFKTQEAPVFILIGADGKEQLVNYRLKNGYYLIDKIFSKAALIIGVGSDQQKVVITRGCEKRTSFGGCAAEEHGAVNHVGN